MLDSLLFGIKNRSGEEGDGGGEFFKFGVGGGLHIVARAGIIEKETSSESLAVFGVIPCFFGFRARGVVCLIVFD